MNNRKLKKALKKYAEGRPLTHRELRYLEKHYSFSAVIRRVCRKLTKFFEGWADTFSKWTQTAEAKKLIADAGDIVTAGKSYKCSRTVMPRQRYLPEPPPGAVNWISVVCPNCGELCWANSTIQKKIKEGATLVCGGCASKHQRPSR